jgi:hypothetical protein
MRLVARMINEATTRRTSIDVHIGSRPTTARTPELPRMKCAFECPMSNIRLVIRPLRGEDSAREFSSIVFGRLRRVLRAAMTAIVSDQVQLIEFARAQDAAWRAVWRRFGPQDSDQSRLHRPLSLQPA